MICQHCQQEHPADSLFCPLTGKKIIQPLLCAGCGQPIDPEWQHCSFCGRRQNLAETFLAPLEELTASETQSGSTAPEVHPNTMLKNSNEPDKEIGPIIDEEPQDIIQSSMVGTLAVELVSNNSEEHDPEFFPETMPISPESVQVTDESMLRCPHCYEEHPADSQFCPFTGKQIEPPEFCSGCGLPVEPGWQVCKNCGQKLNRIEVELKKQEVPSEGNNQTLVLASGLSTINQAIEPPTQVEESGPENPAESQGTSDANLIDELSGEILTGNIDELEPAPSPIIGINSEGVAGESLSQLQDPQVIPSPLIPTEILEAKLPAIFEIPTPVETPAPITGEPKLQCPHCLEQHPADSLFCPFTGKAINLFEFCPGCSLPVEPGWQRCKNCGREFDRSIEDSKQQEIHSESENQAVLLRPGLSADIDPVEFPVQTEVIGQENPEVPEIINQPGAIIEIPAVPLPNNTEEPEPEPLPETVTISKGTPALVQAPQLEQVIQVPVTPVEPFAGPVQTTGEPALLRCPHCNQEHQANLLFCPQTGKIINTPKFCPGCGKPVEPGWQNCGFCGNQLLEITSATKTGKSLHWAESPNARKWIILGCAGTAIIATIICVILLVGLVVFKGFGKPTIPQSALPSSTKNALSMPVLSPTKTIIPTKIITPTAFMTPTFAVTQTPVQTGTPWPIPRLTYPCISYYDQTNGDLKFICRSKNQWEPASVVDAAGDVGLFSSLSFDPKGLAHISYYSQSNGDLKYAFHDGTNWNVQTVDTSDDVGLFTSLALDWDGNAFIGYYDRTNQTVKLARQQAGKWDIQTVDQIGPLTSEVLLTEQMRISLALDRNGYPLLSYQSKIPHQLQLARWTGSEYTIETVDNGPDVGSFCSMALNTLGYPLISYYDETNGNLKLAEWDGQNWKLEVVDGGGSDVGKFSSLAIDQKDNLYISYFADENNEDWLKVAFQKNGTWNIVSFSSGKKRFRLGWGYHTSITLDAQDNPYVAYLANTVKDLNVQYWQGKTALRYYVDSGGSVGLYPSIKFMPDYSVQ